MISGTSMQPNHIVTILIHKTRRIVGRCPNINHNISGFISCKDGIYYFYIYICFYSSMVAALGGQERIIEFIKIQGVQVS